MHFGMPKVSPNSMKDFLGQYLMIVLGVLTALALNAWVEHVQHAHAAADASAQIEAELRTNLEDIQRTRSHDARRLKALEHLRDSLLQDVKAGLPDAVIEQHILANANDAWFGLNTVTPRREAWDQAVANQSIGWIDKTHLRQYATLYARLDAYAGHSRVNEQLNLQGTNISDVVLDVQTGSVQPRKFLYAVNRMTSAMHDAVVMLDELQQDYRENMPSAFANVHAKPH